MITIWYEAYEDSIRRCTTEKITGKEVFATWIASHKSVGHIVRRSEL